MRAFEGMGLRAYARVRLPGGRVLHLFGEGHLEEYSPAPADAIRRLWKSTPGLALFLEARLDGALPGLDGNLRDLAVACREKSFPGRCVPVDARQGNLPGNRRLPDPLPPLDEYLKECEDFLRRTRATVHGSADRWIREVAWRAFEPHHLRLDWSRVTSPHTHIRARSRAVGSALMDAYAASAILAAPEHALLFYGGAAHVVGIARLLKAAGCKLEALVLREGVKLETPRPLRPGARTRSRR